MTFQKHPDGFSTHARNYLALDCLLSHQAYRPASPAFRRLTAHHGNNALLLGLVENLAGSRSLPFLQSALQAASVVCLLYGLPLTVPDSATKLMFDRASCLIVLQLGVTPFGGKDSARDKVSE